MALTEEQIKELKGQLIQQIGHLPPEKKEEARRQIVEMSSAAIEAMVQQQKARGEIFRKIANKEIDSVYVGENENAVAVLDINPISRGHTLVIPKRAVKTAKQIPKTAFNLAEELAKKISANLGAKSVKIETDATLGEAVIHLIPIYDEPLSLDSERRSVSKEELLEIKRKLEAMKIEKKVEKIKIKKEPEKKEEVVKLRRRIP